MYLDPKSKFAGYSLLLIRNALKNVGGIDIIVDNFAYYLDVDIAKAQHIIDELVKNKFIEKRDTINGKQLYARTINGNALVMASAAKPITRKTADKKLAEFLDRAKIVNSSSDYLCRIKKIAIFGSYLSDNEKINDIDLDVKLESKFSNLPQKEISEITRKHVEKAKRNGKRFNTYPEELAWAALEVLKFLKSRSRALSIHSGDDILKQVKHKILFDDTQK